VLATAVTSTTVSPMETRTAPSAWRASSPVSMVTVCGPYGNDLLTTLTAQTSKVNREGEKQRPRGEAAALGFSATESQAFDDFLVLLGLCGSEVIEELAALVDELDEAAARRVIALVRGEVLAQSVDAFREQCHLNFRRAGVGWSAAELCEDAALFLAG